MNFLTLDIIKQQCIIDSDFHDDDIYLTHLGDMAEDLVAAEISCPLEEVVADNNGKLPTPLLHSMLLIVDYMYAQRGSDGNNPDIPTAYMHLCRLYRDYGSAR